MDYKESLYKTLKFESKSLLGRIFKNKPPKLKNGENFLHLGCANNYIEGFTNADFFKFSKGFNKIDWQLDLRYKLNCPDQVFDAVYTEHTLEHLYPTEVKSLFLEIRRILKPSGIIRISVPDLELYIKYYNGIKVSDEFLQFPRGGCEAIRNLTQNYYHRSLWDYKELKFFLESTGFKNISKKGFMSGQNEKILIDKDERKWESLYVEAIK